MNVIDSEQLIALVHNRRAIWDKRIKEHSNRILVAKCWKEISQKMKIGEHELRKKWKYLRDQFAIEMAKRQRQRSDQPSKWRYFNYLTFLKGIVTFKAGSNTIFTSKEREEQDFQNMDTNSDNPDAVEDVNEIKFGTTAIDEAANAEDRNDIVEENVIIKSEVVDTPIEDLSIPDLSSSKAPTGPLNVRKRRTLTTRTKRLRRDNYTTSLLEIEHNKLKLLTQETEKNKSNCLDDQDMLFFKSLISHVKKIRPERILIFRSKINELVQEFAYPTDSYQQPQIKNSPIPYSVSSASTMQSTQPPEDGR